MNSNMATQYSTLIIFAFSMLFSLPDNVLAGPVYKWTDKDGKVHFSDKPPKENSSVNQVAIKSPPKHTNNTFVDGTRFAEDAKNSRPSTIKPPKYHPKAQLNNKASRSSSRNNSNATPNTGSGNFKQNRDNAYADCRKNHDTNCRAYSKTNNQKELDQALKERRGVNQHVYKNGVRIQ